MPGFFHSTIHKLSGDLSIVLHESVVCFVLFFKLWCNIPLCGYTTIYLSILLLIHIWVPFLSSLISSSPLPFLLPSLLQILAMKNNAAMNTLARLLVDTALIWILGVCPGVELLDHRVGVFRNIEPICRSMCMQVDTSWCEEQANCRWKTTVLALAPALINFMIFRELVYLS